MCVESRSTELVHKLITDVDPYRPFINYVLRGTKKKQPHIAIIDKTSLKIARVFNADP